MYPFSNFRSNQYWTASPERKAQKFYVTLCLYISAALDFAVGLDLKEDRKLNWSTTASYYSIVHAARMIVFAAIGDYPMRHESLSELLRLENRPQRGNWLRRFDPNYVASNRTDAESFSVTEIARHYRDNLNLTNSTDLFEAIGKILNNAQDLRNNSNYEALLIAHEYSHVLVTKLFENLANAMSEGAEICLKVATQCFQRYIESDESLSEVRSSVKYFVRTYLTKRIYSPIKYRVGKPYILRRVKARTRPLEASFTNIDQNARNSDIAVAFQELEEWVSFDLFSEKRSLMRTFESRIVELNSNIRSASENALIPENHQNEIWNS